MSSTQAESDTETNKPGFSSAEIICGPREYLRATLCLLIR